MTQMLKCGERAVFGYLRVTLTSNGFKISPHQQNIHPSLNQRAMRHPAPVIILMSDTTLSLSLLHPQVMWPSVLKFLAIFSLPTIVKFILLFHHSFVFFTKEEVISTFFVCFNTFTCVCYYCVFIIINIRFSALDVGAKKKKDFFILKHVKGHVFGEWVVTYSKS